MSFEFLQLLLIERTEGVDLTLLVPMFVSNCHAFKPPVSEVYLLDVGCQTAFWFSLFPEALLADWRFRFASTHQSKPALNPTLCLRRFANAAFIVSLVSDSAADDSTLSLDSARAGSSVNTKLFSILRIERILSIARLRAILIIHACPTLRAVIRRLTPDLHENFLKKILRVGTNLQHAHGEREDERGATIVKLAEGVAILIRDLPDKMNSGCGFGVH